MNDKELKDYAEEREDMKKDNTLIGSLLFIGVLLLIVTGIISISL